MDRCEHGKPLGTGCFNCMRAERDALKAEVERSIKRAGGWQIRMNEAEARCRDLEGVLDMADRLSETCTISKEGWNITMLFSLTAQERFIEARAALKDTRNGEEG